MKDDLAALGDQTERVERHWIGGRKADLRVYRLPIEHLYFNIENGRYADRMIRLQQENPGQLIDPRQEVWRDQIEKMLAGDHRDTSRDKAAFEKLTDDIEARDQLRPGVVLQDGGVLDGNRRLAALRSLWRRSKNDVRFRMFEAVILPDETTGEDRWRIEAGLQLGISERWDYSPINELLKVRQGIRMYEELIKAKRLPASQSPVKLVAKAIYGKSEADVQEMDSRLRLIDEYLQFIGKPSAYDQIGQMSEDFLEAARIVRAAENHQLELMFIGKLKAVLFCLIDNETMNNWELRSIYHALGGDPRKRGRKPGNPNMPALKEFLGSFPEPRAIRESLVARHNPVPIPTTKTAADKKVATTPASTSEPNVDLQRVESAADAFKRRMEIASKNVSVRKMAERARAELRGLAEELAKASVQKTLSASERQGVRDAMKEIASLVEECTKRA